MTESTQTPVVFNTRPTQSEQIGELAEALSKFQGACETPKKDKTAIIPMKSGGQYKYNYSDLGTVITTSKKLLAENGLAVSQNTREVVNGHFNIETKLLHKSGQWLFSELPLPIAERPQDLGSLMTYYRRYAYVAILGLASEEDDDANLPQGNDGAKVGPKESSKPAAAKAAPKEPPKGPVPNAEYKIPFEGPYKGKLITAVDIKALEGYAEHIENKCIENPKLRSPQVEDFFKRVLELMAAKPKEDNFKE